MAVEVRRGRRNILSVVLSVLLVDTGTVVENFFVAGVFFLEQEGWVIEQLFVGVPDYITDVSRNPDFGQIW